MLGGIENHIKTLAEAQAAAGHQVTVLVCDPGHRTRVEVLNGVKVIKAGRLTTVASMPISFSQPLVVARLKPDLIHVQSPYPLGEMSAWLLARSIPVVISYQSDIVRQKGWLRLYAPFLRRVLCHADRVLANSPRYIETSPWLQPVKHKCMSVPIGVNTRRFVPPVRPYDGPPTLLFVGRLRYYKGLDTLVQAMTDLSGVRLKLVGEGQMRDALEAQVQKFGIGDRVHFAGDVSDRDLPAAYHQANVFVLPSSARAEAYGIVLLEAMASGLPCITTEVGTGTSWLVQHGITGLVVPPRDPRALVQAVRTILDDPQRGVAMGIVARARVEAEFTHERMVARVLAVYEDVLAA